MAKMLAEKRRVTEYVSADGVTASGARFRSDLVVSRLVLAKNAPWLGRREPRPTTAVPMVAFSTVHTMVA